MATGDQIKGLVRAHFEGNEDTFNTIVLQIAAHEAKLGHNVLASELKQQVTTVRRRRPNVISMPNTNPMLSLTMPDKQLKDLVVSADIESKIQRILNEYRHKNKLHAYGLMNRRKILLEGPPGTGKTMTAAVVAGELSLPLYTVLTDRLITKFMGETSAKLRQVFDSISTQPGVYLFDEFDALGAERSLDNEVGEMRRVLSSFLQFFEQDGSESIIMAATNNPKLLDAALFRRFDDILHYALPTKEEIRRLFSGNLGGYDPDFLLTERIVASAVGLNHAEIVKACEDAIKLSILSRHALTEEIMLTLLEERKSGSSFKEA